MGLNLFDTGLSIFADTIGGALTVTNDGTKTVLTGLTGDYISLAGQTTSHSLNANTDLVVTELEANGTAFFDTGLNCYGTLGIADDDVNITLGLGTDLLTLYETADSDAKCWLFMVYEAGDSGNNVPAFVFSEYTNLTNADIGLLDEVVEPHIVALANSGQLHSATDGIADEGSASAILKHVGGFTNGAVGDIVRITAGTLCTTGWYIIITRTSADQVTLDRDYTSGDTTNVAFQTWHKMGMVTSHALYLPAYSGAPSDSDIDINLAGAMAINATGDTDKGQIYWRGADGSWSYITKTGGLSMTKEERIDPSGHEFQIGDKVELVVDKIDEDGSFHAEPVFVN